MQSVIGGCHNFYFNICLFSCVFMKSNMCTNEVSMAQDFVGSNNLPMLHSSGMFGTRLEVNSSTICGVNLVFYPYVYI
jgi:hypothetical protein